MVKWEIHVKVPFHGRRPRATCVCLHFSRTKHSQAAAEKNSVAKRAEGYMLCRRTALTSHDAQTQLGPTRTQRRVERPAAASRNRGEDSRPNRIAGVKYSTIRYQEHDTTLGPYTAPPRKANDQLRSCSQNKRSICTILIWRGKNNVTTLRCAAMIRDQT